MGKKITSSSKKTKSNNKKTNNNKNHNKNSTTKVKARSWVDQIRFYPVDDETGGTYKDENDGNHQDDSIDDNNNHYQQQQKLCVEEVQQDLQPQNVDDTVTQNATTNETSTTCTSAKQGDDESISIISWNVLAESYCSRRSHRNLPHIYQRTVFNPIHRRSAIRHILSTTFIDTCQADVICLQEVDLNQIGRCMKEKGYSGIESPRSVKGNNGGRVDACAIYVNTTKWTIIDYEIIQLDDLATLSTTNTIKNDSTTNSNFSTPPRNKTREMLLSNTNGNVQGIQQSFLRRNIAVLVRVSKNNPLDPNLQSTCVIANAHLFWNPSYEYVKLSQAHYILQRAKQFLLSDNEPFIFCGDFNSRPFGTTHSYLSNGYINAKMCAPWYSNQTTSWTESFNSTKSEDDDKLGSENEAINEDGNDNEKEDEDDVSDSDSKDENDDETNQILSIADNIIIESTQENQPSMLPDSDLPELLDKLTLYKTKIRQREQEEDAFRNDINGHDKKLPTPQVRYLLDATLNKFCRWLRILGQDAALETEAEEKMRTGEGKMILFDRSLNENRTLVTTSTRLLHRRDCPSSVYCISPQTLPKLEVALVHMLLTHGVVLDPSTFLSRCVMCNGRIVEVYNIEQKKKILLEYQAPTELVDDNKLDVYECDKCKQGYWWCDRPTSSASRVKNAACELFELCLRAGVPCIRKQSRRRMSPPIPTDTETATESDTNEADEGDETDDDMFAHLDEKELYEKGWDYTIPGSELLRQQLDVIQWMKNEHLVSPFNNQLRSAYAMNDRENGENIGERLPFTNVTFDFVSTLDYIFYKRNTFATVKELMYVPKSFTELNTLQIENGHLLPSNLWPSDHLAIGAKLVFHNRPDTAKLVENNIKDNGTSIIYNKESSNQTQECNPDAQSDEVTDGIKTEPTNATSLSEPVPIDTGKPEETFQQERNEVQKLEKDSIVPDLSTNTNNGSNNIKSSDAGIVDASLSFPWASPHNSRCQCGCVPAIPSLFEMAQMRKLAAAKKNTDGNK